MVNSWEEDPLERHLNYESDEEFGHPNVSQIGSHKTELSEWTAQDFAFIYTRFHPHLIRHAKRYLLNNSQAEEVVQEAFLYLMTSLPEIDTADGVLRFLKWKTKFLALDILRSKASKSEFTGLPDELEIVDYESGFGDIERAEDAAVIQLALSKLSPRQRDVLIKSTYEELSIENIGKQLNIKPNAVRQLLHRARTAFRKALVGESELAGMSSSEILGVAVRKAARDAKANSVRTSVFLLLIGLGAGLWNQQLATGTTETISSEAFATPSEPLIRKDQFGDEVTPTPSENQKQMIKVEKDTTGSTNITTVESLESTERIGDAPKIQTSSPEGEVPREDAIQTGADFSTPLATVVYQAGVYSESYSLKFSDVFRGSSVEVFGGTGISAFLDLQLGNEPSIGQVVFQVRSSSGQLYYGLPEEFSVSEKDNALTVTAARIHLVDRDNKVMENSPFLSKSVEVRLQLDSQATPVSASLFIR